MSISPACSSCAARYSHSPIFRWHSRHVAVALSPRTATFPGPGKVVEHSEQVGRKLLQSKNQHTSYTADICHKTTAVSFATSWSDLIPTSEEDPQPCIPLDPNNQLDSNYHASTLGETLEKVESQCQYARRFYFCFCSRQTTLFLGSLTNTQIVRTFLARLNSRRGGTARVIGRAHIFHIHNIFTAFTLHRNIQVLELQYFNTIQFKWRERQSHAATRSRHCRSLRNGGSDLPHHPSPEISSES
jgi:hypothetical protein